MQDEFAWLPFLLQTADALFPTGAYAHSLGFEESVRLGIVRNETSLRDFVLSQIIPALANQELPYLRFAADASHREDMPLLLQIDHEISAWKLAKETREASATLGVRRLKALLNISEAPLLSRFEEQITAGHAHGHHLVVFGMQTALGNVPMHAALGSYFYQALAAVCGAALKLIRIGQDAMQRVLREAGLHVMDSIERSLAVSRHDAGWFNPMLEIASMRHERAEERLFIS